MSEDTLIAALEDDARAEQERLLEEARSSASAIREEIGAEVSSERQRRVAEAASDMLARRAALLNAAAMRASGEVLAVRHDLLKKAFDAALKRFSSMPKEQYAELLNRLLSELEADWKKMRPTDEPVVLLAPADIGLVKTSFETRADEGVLLGAVLATGDGTVRYENTVASRLSSARAAITPVVNSTLFGGAVQ